MLLPGEAAKAMEADRDGADRAPLDAAAAGGAPDTPAAAPEGLGAASRARARLAALQEQAGAAYDAISAADAELRLLAARRVAAERVLRHDAAAHEAAARALAAHDGTRPGVGALLAGRLRALAEWRAGREPLAAALAGVDGELALSRAAVAEAKDAFAARVGVRAESVAELRRLTTECAAATEEIITLTTAGQPGQAPEPQ
jgi:hypothetical protein